MNYQGWEVTDEWQKYRDGVDYNTRLDYYKHVDDNYAFVQGDQWRGVVANGLSTPVFNIIKRVRDYKVASIMSKRIKAVYNVENIATNTQDPAELQIKELADIMTNYAEIKWEKEKMDSKIRECLMDGFTTGDYAIYTYWDSEYETGQDAKGDFRCEIVDGVNVMFGNPNCSEVERQPYILILGRDTVKNLKEEAKKNGAKKSDIERITRDTDFEYQAGDEGKIEIERGADGNGKALYIIKLWKDKGMVYYSKSTKHCKIRDKIPMKIKKYPLAFGNWEKVKNSYHGRAECTGMLPNQRYINKQFAMIMTWMMFNALGKVAYDTTRIPSWTNQIGVAVPVNGDITGAIQQINPGSMNGAILDVVNMSISETLNSLGANDVVLGDVKPENTSAIIAVQKQSAVPLENVQANLYQMIEDLFLIWAEFMIAMYTVDRNLPQKVDGDVEYVNFNSQMLQDKLMSVRVDVGASSYWSEITAMQTLDTLLQGQYIDFIQYLDRIPNGIIPKKQELLDEIKERMEQQQLMQEQQMLQEQIMQEQAMQEEQQNIDYENMAQIIEQLPPEVQQEFLNLPPEEQEIAVQEFIQGGGLNA